MQDVGKATNKSRFLRCQEFNSDTSHKSHTVIYIEAVDPDTNGVTPTTSQYRSGAKGDGRKESNV